jgi:hypothetical protein
MWVDSQATPLPLYPRGRDPVGWATEPVLKDAPNLARTGIGSPNRPARNESLYRLRYVGQQFPVSLKVKYVGS